MAPVQGWHGNSLIVPYSFQEEEKEDKEGEKKERGGGRNMITSRQSGGGKGENKLSNTEDESIDMEESIDGQRPVREIH